LQDAYESTNYSGKLFIAISTNYLAVEKNV